MTDRGGNRLVFVRLLARSARSEVMEVTRGAGERLALKIVFDGDDAFEREVAVLEHVVHEHVVPVLDHGVHEAGMRWLLMPLYEGTTLRDRLRGGRSLSPRRAAKLFREYLAGLGALHAAGWLHRDVAPKNLFIGREATGAGRRRGLVMDLGRAALERHPPLSTSRHVTGTPPYLAPEQVLSGRVDQRADLFSLALCMFEALAGRPAFEGRDPYEVIDASPPHLAEIVPHPAYRPVGDVIARATRLRPADRYATAADFSRAIEVAMSAATEEAA